MDLVEGGFNCAEVVPWVGAYHHCSAGYVDRSTAVGVHDRNKRLKDLFGRASGLR